MDYPFLVLIVVVLAGLLCWFNKHVRKLLSRNVYVKLGLIFFFFIIVGTIGMHLFERNVNPNFETFYESFWSSVVFLLSGYEDRAPITVPGQIVSILIFIASIGILGSVAGNFAYLFMKQEEIKVSNKVKGHIIICNWNDKGRKIIQELHADIAVPDTPIIILSENGIEADALKDLRTNYKGFENVEFRKADPSLPEILINARIEFARSVIILADHSCPDADARSCLIAVAVSSIFKAKKEEKPYLVAEAINQDKIIHLENAGVDETVCPVDYGISLLSQCAIYPKLSEVYEKLLTYSNDTNEVYVLRSRILSRYISGKTFAEVSGNFIKIRDDDNPVILIGLKRGDQIILNPKKDSSGGSFTLDQEDGLIVISYHNPDIETIITKLQEVE